MRSMFFAGLLALSFTSFSSFAEFRTFGQMTSDQKTELQEFEQMFTEAGFWPQLGALTSNLTSFVGYCGYGLTETITNGVIGTLPAGSALGNTIMQGLRDESYNITADELDLAVRQDLDLIDFPDLESEAEMGQYYGGAISLVLDLVKYFWDYGDLEIEQQHWQKLDGAMLAYINSRDVTLGPSSNCQQSWRRIQIMFGRSLDKIIVNEAELAAE
ncbi:MAG: hypothetical protein HRT45_14420 [Bdellovibrionales bacterium]|nr:hypothetical protein [Bdellovibrionales bacterium]